MHISLTHTSGVPMYEQIVEQIRHGVYSGELIAGEALPSLRQLARDLEVSLITTTRAYNDLAAEGIIVNQPGRGSYVLPVDPAVVKGRLAERLKTEAQAISRTAHLAGLSEQQLLRIVTDAYLEDPDHV